MLLPDELDQSLFVARLPDDVVASLPQQRREALPQQDVVVGDRDAGCLFRCRHSAFLRAPGGVRNEQRIRTGQQVCVHAKYRATTRPLAVWRAAVGAAIIHAMTGRLTPDPPLTCLIVDDSPEFLDAAGQLLADDGITLVGLAATSDEAVEETLARRPDVALVDVELGTESGVDVARQLARLPDGGPPVILISAESLNELAELVDASGALGFVSKTELSGDAIRGLLARGNSGR
jgi:CheY-like chemotaxis protein